MSPLDPPYPVIGETIRFFREQAGLSQEALAEQAEIHSTEISRLENGIRNPKWETMKRLARGLGITMERLVGHAERLDLERGESTQPGAA